MTFSVDRRHKNKRSVELPMMHRTSKREGKERCFLSRKSIFSKQPRPSTFQTVCSYLARGSQEKVKHSNIPRWEGEKEKERKGVTDTLTASCKTNSEKPSPVHPARFPIRKREKLHPMRPCYAM